MIDYTSDPFFWQRFLKCAGFYTDLIDGSFGKNSLKAAHEFETASIALANSAGAFDGRSEGNIQMLLPGAQRLARQFMTAISTATPASVVIKIISGTRTFAEQDFLYAQGRTRPGKRVTNAMGGQSNHNFGVAWDVGIFKNGQYLDDSPLYAKVGAIGESLGLEWGGHWTSIQDEPHFQVVPESQLKAIAAKFQNGEAIV